MAFDIFLTLFLVALNGVFVAAEFAIVKVRISQVESKSLGGNKLAKGALIVVNNLDAYLSATQLGITLASLGLGWIGEGVVAKIVVNIMNLVGYQADEKLAHQIAVPVSFLLITVLHIVFGELAPKSIAIRYPERTTMMLAAPLRAFYWLFRPAIWVLNGFASFILKLVGVPVVHEHDTHTEDELRLLLAESKESGTINFSEHELIENVFKFDDRVAEQIMIPRTKVVAINVLANFDEVISKINEEGYSRMPVYENTIDNVVGIVYSKDLLKVVHTKDTFNLKNIIRPAHIISEKKSINTVLKELQHKHIQMAILVDEFGGMSGILTMEDIVEEIVGDIQDEYDNEVPNVQKKNDTEFIVDALSSIEEVNKHLPENLPQSEDYETVSGLLNEVFGRIPDANESVQPEGYNYSFTILKKSNNAVESVLIKYTNPKLEEKPTILYE